nr:hypothetical protein [Tanacetum cinerariifolium]
LGPAVVADAAKGLGPHLPPVRGLGFEVDADALAVKLVVDDVAELFSVAARYQEGRLIAAARQAQLVVLDVAHPRGGLPPVK